MSDFVMMKKPKKPRDRERFYERTYSWSAYGTFDDIMEMKEKLIKQVEKATGLSNIPNNKISFECDYEENYFEISYITEIDLKELDKYQEDCKTYGAWYKANKKKIETYKKEAKARAKTAKLQKAKVRLEAELAKLEAKLNG